MILVGADRVTANGDTINKIGTYPLAVIAKENDIPFYVALPLSTIDPEMSSGADIDLEEREAEEVTQFGNTPITPKKADAFNPAYDLTPHKYITGFITERGILKPDFKESISSLFD
jgi:methylthioribose-1-phosphate isomerase